MAGMFRGAAARTGNVALTILILFVMGFWFGGGLLAGTIVARILQRQFADAPQQAELISSSVLFWFSTTVIIATGVLTLITFFLERRRKALWLMLGAMAILAIINQYAINAWLSHTAEGSRATLDQIYTGIYFFQVAAAFGFIAVIGLAWKERLGSEVNMIEDVADRGAAGAAGLSPSEASIASPPLAAAVGPCDACPSCSPASPEEPVVPSTPFPFESPERPSLEPPPPPGEETGPAERRAGENGEDGEPDRRT